MMSSYLIWTQFKLENHYLHGLAVTCFKAAESLTQENIKEKSASDTVTHTTEWHGKPLLSIFPDFWGTLTVFLVMS